MTPDEFGKWLEEQEAKLWEAARHPEATYTDQRVWSAVGYVLDMWELVKRDGSES